MTSPAQFSPPPVRHDLLERPALYARLEQSLQGKLTLVSAPAGYGKSALLSAWSLSRRQPVAWLTLATRYNHYPLFCHTLFEALGSAGVKFIDESRALFSSGGTIPPDLAAATLHQACIGLENKHILVLDDYHTMESSESNQLLSNWLALPASQLHLVIITREDPNLPLARLRASGDMLEIRVAQLSLTQAQASMFVQRVAGIKLSDEASLELYKRTEGWITGLQLAGLALQSAEKPLDIIERFGGTHRFVLDYLIEEVMHRLDPPTGSLLRRLAYLEQFNDDLCSAVATECSEVPKLARLEQCNLFILAQDGQRQWYRLHPLFAQTLQKTHPLAQGQLTELHRKASHWFAKAGMTVEAIEHCLLAGATASVVAMLAEHWPALRHHHPDSLLQRWVGMLDEELWRTNAVLCGYYGLSLLAVETEKALALLAESDRLLADKPHDYQQSASVRGMLSIGEAYFAAATGSDRCAGLCQRALQQLPETEHLWRGAAQVLLALDQWRRGALELAAGDLRRALASMETSGDTSSIVSTRYLLAELSLSRGNLTQAVAINGRSRQLIEQWGGVAVQGCADVWVQQAELAYLRSELDDAMAALEFAENLGPQAQLMECRAARWLLLARVHWALNEPESAWQLLGEAERLQAIRPQPDIQPLPAWRALFHLLNHEGGATLAWLEQHRNLPLQPAHVTNTFAASVCLWAAVAGIELWSTDEIEAGIANLQGPGEWAQSPRQKAEAQLLQASWLWRRQCWDEATLNFNHARAFAEAEGFGQLLLERPIPEQLRGRHGAQARRATQSSPIATLAPEVLSPRELEILQWLGGELSGPEIAARLFISMNTFRTHSKNIYAKLGVNNRRAAIGQAQFLALI